MSCNLDPTLTLPNLTTLLENVDWYGVGWRMDISAATLIGMIRDSGSDDSQHRQKCCEVYLSEHPSPSWKQVAHALYIESSLGSTEYLKELEVVQKKYLKGGCAVIISCLSMRTMLSLTN